MYLRESATCPSAGKRFINKTMTVALILMLSVLCKENDFICFRVSKVVPNNAKIV